MDHRAILAALAEPTRLSILDRLRGGPLAVGRIADGLTVTRPAVSQHLRVLHDAGIVSCRKEGTRNVYAIAPGGTRALHVWLAALDPGRNGR